MSGNTLTFNEEWNEREEYKIINKCIDGITHQQGTYSLVCGACDYVSIIVHR